MKAKVIFTFIALAAYSCTSDKTDNTSESIEIFKEPKITQTYFNRVCQGDSCAYIHYIMLASFDEARFNDYNFVYLADKYLDSVKANFPVAAIQFCKPFKFSDVGGSENDDQLRNNAVVALWYELTLKGDKVPEIHHISIWTDGQRKDLDYLQLKSRRQAMSVYDNEK